MTSQHTSPIGLSGSDSGIRYWLGLGIIALAVAGVLALLLAVSRVPGVENVFSWPVDFFRKGLVIHVVLSFVFWFLAIFAALTGAVTATADSFLSRILSRIPLLLGALGLVLLVAPGFMDRGVASLNNYIPVIIDPLYYGGLLCVVLAILLPVGRVLCLTPFADAKELHVGGYIFLMALVVFAWAWYARLGDELSTDYNEDVMWGGGHILQFLNVVLMMAGWRIMVGLSQGGTGINGGLYDLILFLCALPPLVLTAIVLTDPEGGVRFKATFTDFQYLLGMPVLLCAGACALVIGRRHTASTEPIAHTARLCLVLSLAAFFTGGLLGLFVDGTDTRTPAHYHVVIAAVNVSFMGVVGLYLLPLAGGQALVTRAFKVLLWLYTGGQIFAAIGLFMAGGYGAPRKIAGDAQGLEVPAAVMGMYMNGIGAVVAVIGGVMFIVIVGRALSRASV